MSNNIYNSRILIFIFSQAVQDMFEKDMQQAILESKMAFEQQQQQHQVCFKELTWLLAAWSKVNTFVRSGMILRCAHCCVDRGVVRNIISPIALIGLRYLTILPHFLLTFSVLFLWKVPNERSVNSWRLPAHFFFCLTVLFPNYAHAISVCIFSLCVGSLYRCVSGYLCSSFSYLLISDLDLLEILRILRRLYSHLHVCCQSPSLACQTLLSVLVWK